MTSKSSALLALIPPPPPLIDRDASASCRLKGGASTAAVSAPTNPRQWITNPSSARVALGDQTNSERSIIASGGLGSSSGGVNNSNINNKKYVTNLSPLPRCTGGEEPCDPQHAEATSGAVSISANAILAIDLAERQAPAATSASLAVGGDNAKLQCRYTMNKYNFLKSFTVKPKTPGSIEKLRYLQEPARRNVRAALAQMATAPPVHNAPGAEQQLTSALQVPPQRNLVLSPLIPSAQSTCSAAAVEAADASSCGREQLPEPPATVLDNITSTPPPTERNLFHYFADAGLTVVDVLCFDSPMTPPHQRRPDAGDDLNRSDTENPIFYLSPTPTMLGHTGPRVRSRSAPSTFTAPNEEEMTSWHSAVDESSSFYAAGERGNASGGSSRRSRSAPRADSLSLPSPWQRDNTEEGSPFVLDDADDILVEEVSTDSDNGSPAQPPAALDESNAGTVETPPQQPTSSSLEAYSPATIALIATDEEARHELGVYLDTAATMMHALFLQRCTALFSHGCLSLAMVTASRLEESHGRFIIAVDRDAFMRNAVYTFVLELDRKNRRLKDQPPQPAAKTPPASQKSGNGGRRRQYLAPPSTSQLDPPADIDDVRTNGDLTALF